MTRNNETLTVNLGDSLGSRRISAVQAQRVIRGYLVASEYAVAASISMQLAEQLPDELWPHLHAAEALFMDQKIESALRYANCALGIDPTNIPSLIIKSRLHLHAGDRKRAIHCMDSAASLEPDNSSLHFERAALLVDAGDIDGAREGFLKSIALNIRNTASLLGLSRLPEDNFSDELIKNTEFVIQSRQLKGDQQIEAHFALALAYDKKSDTGRHFKHLTAGNKLKSGAVAFDPVAHMNETQTMINFFSKEFFERTADENGNPARVIFITGFPRCGSTLVEQILSSHPDVSDAGETFALVQAMQGFQNSRALAANYPYWMGDQPAGSLTEIADDYMHRLKNFNQRIFLTDKMLSNYKFTGLIHRIFPNAKIINVQRNPIDVCYSCYKRLFMFRSVPYTYDLEHLASRYRDYRKMINHWDEVLPGKIHTVEYEQLIHRQEDITRDLLTHCELPWNDACMNFHKNKRSVHTHSNIQVRQKLYTDSIDRWKPYKDYLAPLLELTNS